MIDPRAGRLVISAINDNNEVVKEWTPLQNCNPDPDFFSNFLYSSDLVRWISRNYCLPADTFVDGLMKNQNSIVPIISIATCDSNKLEDGQTCMDDDELRSYFDGNKQLHLRSSLNFVDYDDIDRPIKSFLVNNAEISLTFGRNKFIDVVLESHEFRDTTTLLQLFAEED